MQPSIPHTVARVRAWLSGPDADHLKIASEAGVDEKTIRLARHNKKWNPTVDTLQRLETVMLGGNCPRAKKRKAA